MAGRTMGMDDIKNYNVTERLRDQRTVTIRAIRPDDKGLIIAQARAWLGGDRDWSGGKN